MKSFRWCLLLFAVLGAVTACNPDFISSGGPNPPATHILNAYADPDTVAVGKTTTLHVVIRDSTESGFDFSWGGFGRVVHTTLPRYTWTADLPPGRHRLAVHVDRAGFQTAAKGFYVTVLPAE